MSRRSLQLVHWLLAPVALVALAGLALAADTAREEGASYRFFSDVFVSGGEVRVGGPEVEDLFAAGETVTLDTNVTETAHLAGREIRINSAVGENVYAAGYSVYVEAPVGEDVIAAGYRVEIGPNASVAQDVLAAGRTVILRGPVAGNVSLSGRTVEVAGPISGSAEIHAREIRFTEGARIDGTLSYWTDEAVEVPPSVIAPERVRANVDVEPPGAVGVWITAMLLFTLIMFTLTALFAFIFRDRLAGTRAVIAARPWRDLLLGVIATSALFGSILVLAVSLIGIPLIPLIILLIPFAILAGYLTTAHAIGAMLIKRAQLVPGSFWAAFGAILVGVLILALVSVIPLIGWIVAVLAVIVGIGAWFAIMLWPPRRGERVFEP